MYLPPTDSTTEGWWRATSTGVLLLQRCSACSHVQHPPRNICTSCGKAELSTFASAGHGTIDSFTTVYRAPMEGFDPPYVVARVRLADGPIVLTNIVGCQPDQLHCDDKVSLQWRPLEDGRRLPVFALAPSSSE